MQSSQQMVNDEIMLILCKKVINTQDIDAQLVADFIKQNKDEIDLNYFSVKTGNWAPIHFAAKLGKENILRMLVEQGANPFLPIGAICKKLGVRMTWKTGITLIPEELFNLRREIEQLFLVQNAKYNQGNSFLSLGDGILCSIASNFIENKESFCNLYRTCSSTRNLLSEYVDELKTVNKLQKKMSDKCVTASANRSYNPYYDEMYMPNTVAEAMARRREYNDVADALDKESEVLERKIQELKTSLVSKLKF